MRKIVVGTAFLAMAVLNVSILLAVGVDFVTGRLLLAVVIELEIALAISAGIFFLTWKGHQYNVAARSARTPPRGDDTDGR